MRDIKKLALAIAVASTSTISVAPTAFGAVALEEVVVTARKREEVIQEVPVAITAVTAETLERSVVANFEEATRLTPGFSAPQASTSSTALALSLRGSVQNDAIIMTDPSVGVYVDGVYIARSFGLGMDLVDLQDVQVLKGPQGTLFGRNTTAGALLLNSKSPELNQFTGQVALSAGPEFKRETGIVNIPIFDTMALRIALQQSERDDYIDNKAICQPSTTVPCIDKNWDSKLGGRDTNTYRTKFRWMPTDELDLTLAYDRFHIADRTGGGQLWRQGNVQPHKPDVVSLNFDNYNATDTDTLTFTGVYDSGIGEFKLLASQRNWQNMREMDYDGGNLAGVTRHGSWGREAGDQQSYELQFNTSFFDEKVDLVSGITYFKEFGQSYDYSYGRNPFIQNPVALQGFVGGNYMENNVESKGAYAQGTWHINDVSNLTLGLRYSEDEKEGGIWGETSTAATRRLPSWDFNAHKNTMFNRTLPGSPLVTVQRPTDTWESVNWMASYDYKILDDVMVYAKISTGFRSGGFNGRGARLDANGNPVVPLVFNPENITEYEVGWKGDFFDRSLRWNTAIWMNETEDKQLTTILNSSDGGPPGTAIVNAGKAEANGFETELSYLLNDNWQISGSYAYINSDVTEKKQAGVDLESPELPLLQFVPQNQWTLAVKYDQEFTQFKLSGTASYSWIDHMYGNDKKATTAYKDAIVCNTAVPAVCTPSLTGDQARSFVKANTTDAYGLLNLNLTVSPLDDKYSFTLWVKNALDERAISSTIGFISGTTYQYVRGVYTEPRTWGGTVTVNF